jgi:hypothetical protein
MALHASQEQELRQLYIRIADARDGHPPARTVRRTGKDHAPVPAAIRKAAQIPPAEISPAELSPEEQRASEPASEAAPVAAKPEPPQALPIILRPPPQEDGRVKRAVKAVGRLTHNQAKIERARIVRMPK